MADQATKPRPKISDFLRLDIDPKHGDPPQPMLKLSLMPGKSAVLLAYQAVDDLIAELIQRRDILEDLFRKRYPKADEDHQ